MIRRVPIDWFLRVDTEARTVALVVAARGGEGELVMLRAEDITALFAGAAGAERRDKLRGIFEAVEALALPTPDSPDPESQALTEQYGDPAARRGDTG
jgi:hypothetical protein